MPRFSLRAFLIACLALGVCLALTLKWRWRTRVGLKEVIAVTKNGAEYLVGPMVEQRAFEPSRLLNVVVVPAGTTYEGSTSGNRREVPRGRGIEIMPRGVFLNGKLVGGQGTSKVVIVLGERDVRALELSIADLQALEAAIGPRMIESPVWKEKVEPQIERLVRARGNAFDRRALGLAP
ncbi:MAG: hypothetical protein L0211_11555 [Planctomycetaceae bacterium]|nr:hypothetical protein [Planctomycetaceae bacterium]